VGVCRWGLGEERNKGWRGKKGCRVGRGGYAVRGVFLKEPDKVAEKRDREIQTL
jgi:hypothetical protein